MLPFPSARCASANITSLLKAHPTQAQLSDLISLKNYAETIELTARSRVSSHHTGNHISNFHGRGIDFAEVRAYQAGDEVRHMDWRVTARMDRPHIKMYHEDCDRPVYFMVDFSPSMYFSTRIAFKSVFASYTAALLAWASAKQNNRVGGMLISPTGHIESRPQPSTKGVLNLLKLLSLQAENHMESNQNIFVDTLRRARHLTRPGSLLFIISDFYQLSAEAESHLSQLSLHSDIININISDPLEKKLPSPNLYKITNGTEITDLDTRNKHLRSQYALEYEQRIDHIKSLCKKWKIKYIQLSTDLPLLSTLQCFFGRRRH